MISGASYQFHFYGAFYFDCIVLNSHSLFSFPFFFLLITLQGVMADHSHKFNIGQHWQVGSTLGLEPRAARFTTHSTDHYTTNPFVQQLQEWNKP